jgi:hypothetical protein
MRLGFQKNNGKISTLIILYKNTTLKLSGIVCSPAILLDQGLLKETELSQNHCLKGDSERIRQSDG